MVMEMLSSSIIYPPQASIIVTIVSGIEVLILCNAGFMETKGTHMQYSKFWSCSSTSSVDGRVSSRVGMLIFYTPALIAGLLGLLLFPGESLRFYLVAASLVVHFLKRDIEEYESCCTENVKARHAGWRDSTKSEAICVNTAE